MAEKELFISYGREPETVDFVRLLKRDLESRGMSVWLDSEDISSGCDWYSAIGQGLENCRGIVAVITNKYINSHYCKSELYTANNDKKLIFPVMFEDVDFGATSTAKGVKYIISGINWTMFRPKIDDYNVSLSRLCQGLREQGLGKVGGADCDATDGLTAAMNQLNVSSEAPPTAPPPHLFQTPPYAPPTALPPPSPQAPYIYTAHSPTSFPPSPHYPHSTPPPATPPGNGYSSPYPYPPYPTPPQPPPYVYGHSSGQGYPPYHGYMPPPSQHPGMYMPPLQAPPPPQSADQGPPKYSDLYQSHAAPPVATPPPEPLPLPEKPPISSSSAPGHCDGSTFTVGMKLEAVDRRFPYFVCVATIMDRSESEVLIHFDGWGDGYDYWCPPHAVELHPPGWCERNNWELQTPRDQVWHGWEKYLTYTEADRPPSHVFTADQEAGPGSLKFRAGMSVEAKDRKNPGLTCVATIKKIDNGQLLIHFDGWSENYDYWCDPWSDDIHPPMWCGKNGKKVEPPHGYIESFKWNEYLANPGMIPAPAHLFTKAQLSAGSGRSPRPAAGGQKRLNQFEVNMKLEAKDRLYPTLVAVATIADIRDGQLLIHFDGWTSKYDYWCKPTSTDIHPMGWCARHGHALQPPKGTEGRSFHWAPYLRQCGAKVVPSSAFNRAQTD